MNMDENDLINSLLEGRGEAAREFYCVYSRLIFATIKRNFIGIPDQLAADIHQEVFERLCANDFRVIRAWQRRAPFSAYLKTIVKNTAVDILRTQDPAHAQSSFFGEDGDGPLPEELHETNTPERLALLGELRAALAKCLARLPELSKKIICLRHIDGLRQHEIAESVGLNQSNVGVTIMRSEKNLRECLTVRLGSQPILFANG